MKKCTFFFVYFFFKISFLVCIPDIYEKGSSLSFLNRSEDGIDESASNIKLAAHFCNLVILYDRVFRHFRSSISPCTQELLQNRPLFYLYYKYDCNTLFAGKKSCENSGNDESFSVSFFFHSKLYCCTHLFFFELTFERKLSSHSVPIP